MIKFKKQIPGALFDIIVIKECLCSGGKVFIYNEHTTTVWEIHNFPQYLFHIENCEDNVYFQRTVWPLNEELNEHAGSLL
ncbi:MAG: hypothetical protein ACOC5T_08615 [Elusimicrobiota bacterium]